MGDVVKSERKMDGMHSLRSCMEPVHDADVGVGMGSSMSSLYTSTSPCVVSPSAVDSACVSNGESGSDGDAIDYSFFMVARSVQTF